MIVALAGRRVDAPHADPERFPLRCVEAVRHRILAAFRSHGAMALVSAAACGADLLALSVAEECGMRRHIVLPLAPPEFRERSVVDRPGGWGPLFDHVLAAAAVGGNIEVLPSATQPDAIFLAGNAAILERALALGKARAESVRAFAVWDGPIGGRTDYTEDFVRAAEQRGIAVSTISVMAAEGA